MAWSAVTFWPLIEMALLAMSLRASPLLDARPVATRMSMRLPKVAVGKLLAKSSTSSVERSVSLPSPKTIAVIFLAAIAASSP